MVPVKSSIGLISSKISSRPDWSGRSLCPVFFSASIRSRQRSLPSSQSKESVCRARRLGGGVWGGFCCRVDRGPPGLVAEQPVEGVGLQGEEAGDFKWFVDTGEGNATWTGCGG